MSMTFTKLFSSITESTIWVEDHETRIVWIAMLAMADRKGRVWGSIPGLANRARVSVEGCRKAIHTFLSPDPDSRTKEEEGRRIREIDGGWQLINYFKYREIRDQETVREQTAKRVASHRKRNVTHGNAQKHQAEAEAEADKSAPSGAMSGKPDSIAHRVLNFLNQKTGKAFRPTPSNLGLIAARLKEGYDEDMCRMVIARKFRDWSKDDKMAPYLRPATLFNREKFNQYAGECVIPQEPSRELP